MQLDALGIAADWNRDGGRIVMGQLHACIITRRLLDDKTSNHHECARIQRVDATDRRILALLVENGRRSLEDLSREVRLSAPAVKRRVDRLRAAGPLRGFTAIVDDEALGWHAEAFVELYLAPDTAVPELLAALNAMPEALGAWTISGDADALAHLRARDNHHLEHLLLELRRKGLVERTRSQIVLSRLLTRVRATADTPEAGAQT